MDVRVERHGDPYLAFVVLMQPDRAPSIVCVGFEDSAPFDMANLKFRATTSDETRSAVLPLAELRQAGLAIDDLLLGVAVASRHRGELRDTIRETMEGQRERRQMRAIAQDLERAEYEAKHPAKCQFCSQRFTERGVKRHESDCSKNPQAKRYGPSGDYEPILQDGRIIGARLRQIDQSPCARCPEVRGRHAADGGACLATGCRCSAYVAPSQRPSITVTTDPEKGS